MFTINNTLMHVISSYYSEQYNNPLSTNYFQNLLFNQTFSLSEAAAKVTALQQLKNVIAVDSNILSSNFLEGLIRENLFSFSFIIIIVAFFSRLYTNSFRLSLSMVAKAMQLFLYVIFIVLLQFVLIDTTNLGSIFFEVILLVLLLFLALLATASSIINIKSMEVPILFCIVGCFG
jgi:hypothetical protein